MSATAADHPHPATPDRDPESAWLAAYALGLAYSRNGHQRQVELLLDAADGGPELLERARQRLASTEVADPHLREVAQRLLQRACTLRTNELCQPASGRTGRPLHGS